MDTENVGSNPIWITIFCSPNVNKMFIDILNFFGAVVQLARTSDLQSEDRGFETLQLHIYCIHSSIGRMRDL